MMSDKIKPHAIVALIEIGYHGNLGLVKAVGTQLFVRVIPSNIAQTLSIFLRDDGRGIAFNRYHGSGHINN
jgi:hypothetical protein